MSVDSTAPLSIGDITCSGTLHIDTIAPRVATEITIAGSCVVDGALMVDTMRSSLSDRIQVDDNFTIVGNLTVNGFIAARPYASLRILTTGGTPSTVTTVGNIGTPGTVSLFQQGFLTNVSLMRGTAGTTNLFLYSFTLPTAHPLGTNYIVNGGFRTASSTDASPNAFLTFTVISATNFCVWVRSSTGILMDGNLYVYTVP